ncbi:MAG: heavy metal translocating P-type ATPase, partial [bacterium]
MEQEIKDISKFHAKIGGMSCSFCVETIKKAYGKQEGVEKVNVSLSHEEALITYNPSKISKGAIEKTLTDLGYTIRDPRRVKAFEEQEEELRLAKKHLLIAGTFTLISLIFMILMWSGIRLWWFRWPMLSLALATMFGPGWYIKKKAWQSLKRGILNQHTLLEFGAFSGLGGGFMGFFIRSFPLADFFAVSVFVTSYHILGGWVSLLVRTRASQAVQKLLDLQPKTANVIQNGKEIVKEIEELKINDLVRVRPGERIPIDGITIKGYTTVDESVVTGESIPVEKNTGDAVIGGSINLSGSIEIKVNKVGEETFLQQVIKRVEEARALKPSILIIVDKLLQYYVPGVLIIAASAFLFWTVGSFFLFDAWNTTRAIFAALAVLVMGYPCALGMAMPLALIRGGGKAAEKGILMRSGEAFQAFPQIKKIVLDKTGTITKGKPEVVEI